MRAFLIGAAGYPLLELLWRRRTHPSMALAGGLSMAWIHQVNKRTNAGYIAKALLCAAGITGIEAMCGLIWNKHYQVWDYRRMPLHWRGQVCLPFTGVWFLLSLVALKLDKALNRA